MILYGKRLNDFTNIFKKSYHITFVMDRPRCHRQLSLRGTTPDHFPAIKK